jgi:hypothetical protein
VIDWLESQRGLLTWLAAGSVVMFVGSLAAGVVAVVRLPRDYLVRPAPKRIDPRAILRYVLWRMLRVVLGVVLVGAGIAMLVLPGQGLLTIALGLVVLGWPGGHDFAKRMLRKPPVRRAVDRVRRWCGREPLLTRADVVPRGESEGGGHLPKSSSTTMGR